MHTHSRSLLNKTGGTIRSQCLNGWWDFLSQPADAEPADAPPAAGWIENALLVPSFWTKPPDGVRRRGETYFGKKTVADLKADDEFLFDAFGYPLEWSRNRAGWVKREFSLPTIDRDRCYFLNLDAVCPRGTVFLNGTCVGGHDHPALPLSVDVTHTLKPGANTVAVCIRDYDRDARGRPMVPTGNWIPIVHSGGCTHPHIDAAGNTGCRPDRRQCARPHRASEHQRRCDTLAGLGQPGRSTGGAARRCRTAQRRSQRPARSGAE
jgi:hypothetical protein